MANTYAVKVFYGVGQVHRMTARDLKDAQGLASDVLERGLRITVDGGVEEYYLPRQITRIVLEPVV